MASFIVANREYFQGLKILELGSGTGLIGLWAAKFCSKIVLTDKEPLVVDLIQRNIDQNHFPQGLIVKT